VRNCPQCNAECPDQHRFCPACGFPIGALRTQVGDPLIGRKLGGAYVVLEHVGSGGMGKVYRGEQVALGKTVAVKVIHQHLIADENATARFYTEARASSRLNHPNSVSVIDFGRTDEGLLYLVMEFLRGKDLSHILWEEGPLPAPRAVDIVRQVLAALAEGHELGIIHRDIKPENVIIERLRTGGDSVKVVDFGLAKVRADVAPSVTMPGIVCGTPDYMAPEQGRGDPPDTRSDLYAAGVMLYQVLTGRLPYEADSPTQVVLLHMTEPIPDPRAINPTIPESLAKVVFRAMEKDANKRYQNALEFAEALQVALRESVPPNNPRDTLEAIACPSCSAPLARGAKFCSECGYRMNGATEAPRSPNTTVPPAPPKPETIARFVGREHELAVLDETRGKALARSVFSVRITGETGVGKSRLVREFIQRCNSAGDLVVYATPDPSWAGVAWVPIRQIVRACLGLDPTVNPIDWLSRQTAAKNLDAAVRAGFDELFGEGAVQLDGRARRPAVAHAVGFALRSAAARAKSGLCVVLVDQLHRVDTASAAVLSLVSAMDLDASVLLVATHLPRVEPRWRDGEVIVLSGLTQAQAQAVAQSLLGDWYSPPAFEGAEVLPLLADQTSRWMFEGGAQPASRVVDVVASRFDRLPPVARKVLQALALVGEGAPARIEAVIGEPVDEQTWRSLQSRWWIIDNKGTLSIAHELIREVVESATSAAVRADLARRILDETSDLPIEVRALLAAHADEAAQALLLLETVADRANARGDELGAVLALRRGLERSRRELHRGEIDDPERAMTIFARKLGDALARAGEVAEAEGVLREALELAPRGSQDFIRLQLVLARALFGRGRVAEATRVADDALRGARKLNAHSLTAELTQLRADFDLNQGVPFEAVAQLRAADAALEEVERTTHDPRSVSRQRIDVWLRMAKALVAAGQHSAAESALSEATSAAHRSGLFADLARCEAARADVAASQGDVDTAEGLLRRAAASALDCGDVAAAQLYRATAEKIRGRSSSTAGQP
jgi:serine/threonine protein kinase/tetratricopeptide (TPR) repeat protein